MFRISHRIVNRYADGPGVRGRRCRAHPSPDRSPGHEHGHPGRAQPGLEGRARGGRATPRRGCSTVTTPSAGRSARRWSAAPCAAQGQGIGADSTDPDYVIRREAQLLIDYAGSPIVADREPGGRAPDVTGSDPRRGHRTPALVRTARPSRAHRAALRGRRHHRRRSSGCSTSLAEAAVLAARGRMDVYLLAAPDADVAATSCR